MSAGLQQLLLKCFVTYRNTEQLEFDIDLPGVLMLDVSYRDRLERTGTQLTCKNH